ncbi:MAG: HD domain-containing protein [Caulobacteraceae bacterium]
MDRLPSLEALERLNAERAGAAYGEGVSQLEHALQCAVLAETEGAAPSLVAAALLHDVGHLYENEADALEIDRRHEISGAQALKGLFGEAVRAPIALHVAAKRWLCLKEPGYVEALSPASKRTLDLQGGVFDPGEAQAFERLPHWREAVALRRWDDLGKRPEPSGRTFADYLPLLRAIMAA